MPHPDSFLRALSDLDEALDANVVRTQQIKQRIARIREERAEGKSYREIVEAEPLPLIVRLLTESSQTLDEAGARVRRTKALALHDEGMTMDRIAVKFGVTRQRVSGLLSDARSDPR